jgi:hypothetical protein
MINGIVQLSKYLRVAQSTVYRNLKTIWSDLPMIKSKSGKLTSYKFNKQDVWDYFKRKFN